MMLLFPEWCYRNASVLSHLSHLWYGEWWRRNLSLEEQQIAACTSYAYWAYVQYLQNADPPLPSEADHNVVHQSLRIQMAMREAHRHFVGQNYHYQNTVTRLKQTIQWRKDTQIDLLKVAFSSTTAVPTMTTTNTVPIRWTDSNTTQLLHRYERWIPSWTNYVDRRIYKYKPYFLIFHTHCTPHSRRHGQTPLKYRFGIRKVLHQRRTGYWQQEHSAKSADCWHWFWFLVLILHQRKLVPGTCTHYERRVEQNSGLPGSQNAGVVAVPAPPTKFRHQVPISQNR